MFIQSFVQRAWILTGPPRLYCNNNYSVFSVMKSIVVYVFNHSCVQMVLFYKNGFFGFPWASLRTVVVLVSLFQYGVMSFYPNSKINITPSVDAFIPV